MVTCSIFGHVSLPVMDSAATLRNGAFDWLNLDNFLQHFDQPCSCVYDTSPVLLWAPTGIPYRPRTGRRSTCTMVVAVLLLCAGDVELNPCLARLNVNNSARLTADNCSSINVSCLNCRSTGNKAAVIHDTINDYRLDFLVMSETWFTSNTPATVMSNISHAGNAALHMPRSPSADREGPSCGGGLSIVYHESVVVRRHWLAEEFRPSTCELQLVRDARLRSVPHL